MSLIYSAVCREGYVFCHATKFQGNDLYKFTKSVLKNVEKDNRGFLQKHDE